jgi:hypothetical protein
MDILMFGLVQHGMQLAALLGRRGILAIPVVRDLLAVLDLWEVKDSLVVRELDSLVVKVLMDMTEVKDSLVVRELDSLVVKVLMDLWVVKDSLVVRELDSLVVKESDSLVVEEQ